jgi:hypothetical protein
MVRILCFHPAGCIAHVLVIHCVVWVDEECTWGHTGRSGLCRFFDVFAAPKSGPGDGTVFGVTFVT